MEESNSKRQLIVWKQGSYLILDNNFLNVLFSPKMSINIPGMSMKAVFSKDKETTRGSMDNLDSEYILR